MNLGYSVTFLAARVMFYDVRAWVFRSLGSFCFSVLGAGHHGKQVSLDY